MFGNSVRSRTRIAVYAMLGLQQLRADDLICNHQTHAAYSSCSCIQPKAAPFGQWRLNNTCTMHVPTPRKCPSRSFWVTGEHSCWVTERAELYCGTQLERRWSLTSFTRFKHRSAFILNDVENPAWQVDQVCCHSILWTKVYETARRSPVDKKNDMHIVARRPADVRRQWPIGPNGAV